ncbi:MAG: asparagine synthetase B family protein, partial [Bacteroidota bacterium]
MCGLNGIFSSGGDRDWSSAIQRMNLKMAHRGPDADGVYNNRDITLGHRRLSIIDLDPRGTQPMHGLGNRYVIVFNGEIYNFEKLREQVSSYSFQTGTDTEVLLALFAEKGEKMLGLLEGMFAFAIWDNEKEELFIARDRFGKKPLYWWMSDNQDAFLFSSELRSIISSGWLKPQLNRKV